MTNDEAMVVLRHHQREAKLWQERTKPMCGETSDHRSARLGAQWTADKRREADEHAIAKAEEAAARCRVATWLEPPAPVLPALEQVQRRRGK